jgi:glucokinase
VTPTRHLGLDLGGTNIKAAVLEFAASDSAPVVVHSESVSTEAELGPEHVLDRLVSLGRDIRSHTGGIGALGLGVPGLFDPDTGVVERFPNLAGDWVGYGLRDKVGEGIGLIPTMVNDARAFTLAEGTIGAGRGAMVMLGITLGTGIGGGVMIDGQLHTGAFGTAGEFGHQTVSPDGPMCGCGNRGCLEAVASGGALSAEASTVDVERLYAAAAAGDEVAIRTLERASFFMAIAISNAVSLLGVDVVVVGGGIVSSGDLVLDPLRQAVAERVTLVPTNEIRIVAAELGPMAGAIGAALAGAS